MLKGEYESLRELVENVFALVIFQRQYTSIRSCDYDSAPLLHSTVTAQMIQHYALNREIVSFLHHLPLSLFDCNEIKVPTFKVYNSTLKVYLAQN